MLSPNPTPYLEATWNSTVTEDFPIKNLATASDTSAVARGLLLQITCNFRSNFRRFTGGHFRTYALSHFRELHVYAYCRARKASSNYIITSSVIFLLFYATSYETIAVQLEAIRLPQLM